MKNLIFRILLPVALCCNNASAVDFANGDFSATPPETAWNTVQGTDSPGTASFNTGSAVLSTGQTADPYSVSIIQGDDGSFSFAAPITLSANVKTLQFNASFARSFNPSESVGSFMDNLSVHIYDKLGTVPDMNEFVIDANAVSGSFAYGVSAFAGREVALSFELSNENDGYFSSATIKNIQFIGAVPEPEEWVMMMMGVALVGFQVRRKKMMWARSGA